MGDYGGSGIGALALGAALGADEALLAGGGGFIPSVGWYYEQFFTRLTRLT